MCVTVNDLTIVCVTVNDLTILVAKLSILVWLVALKYGFMQVTDRYKIV